MLRLIKNNELYWDFIRKVRCDGRNQHGFLERAEITKEQQEKYMYKHNDEYFICVDEYSGIDYTIPLGFVGSVDGDIRIAVDFANQRNGIGTFMLKEYVKQYVDPIKDVAKVKHDNLASHKIFLKAGFTMFREDESFKYYRVYEL